jgi:hypothetical protein
MKNGLKMASWFCGCLGVALLILGALAHPEVALGDGGEGCQCDYCTIEPAPCPQYCEETCGFKLCLGDFACNFGCKYNGYSQCVDPDLCRTAIGCKGCNCNLYIPDCICEK